MGQRARALGHSSVPLKIFIKYIMMRQRTPICVGNIGGLPPIPHLLRSYIPFFQIDQDRWGSILTRRHHIQGYPPFPPFHSACSSRLSATYFANIGWATCLFDIVEGLLNNSHLRSHHVFACFFLILKYFKATMLPKFYTQELVLTNVWRERDFNRQNFQSYLHPLHHGVCQAIFASGKFAITATTPPPAESNGYIPEKHPLSHTYFCCCRLTTLVFTKTSRTL